MALRTGVAHGLVPAVAAVAAVCAFAVADTPAAAAGCPVTIPRTVVPPDAGMTAAGFNYGNARLRAHLGWPRGVLPAGVLPDGGSYASILANGRIWTKMGWWRGLPGKLVITGRRIDAPAPALRAEVPRGYGPTGFVPAGFVFPTVGCWRVHGKLADATLTFVVRVTKLPSR